MAGSAGLPPIPRRTAANGPPRRAADHTQPALPGRPFSAQKPRAPPLPGINNLTLSVQTGGANGAGPYAAAKGTLHVLTRTLARELAPRSASTP
jgi:NAD(P)-dependent dehydrogenase (short-subunit alcohol dehydrogenase family)